MHSSPTARAFRAHAARQTKKVAAALSHGSRHADAKQRLQPSQVGSGLSGRCSRCTLEADTGFAPPEAAPPPPTAATPQVFTASARPARAGPACPFSACLLCHISTVSRTSPLTSTSASARLPSAKGRNVQTICPFSQASLLCSPCDAFHPFISVQSPAFSLLKPAQPSLQLMYPGSRLISQVSKLDLGAIPHGR